MQSDQENISFKPKRRVRFFSLLVVILIVGTGLGMVAFVVSKIQKDNPVKAESSDAGKTEKDKKPSDQKSQEIQKVKVYKASRGNFSNVMETLGTLQSKSTVDLRFEVNGVVFAINVKEGDAVREGDILAELEHEDANLKVDFRKSKMKEAQIEEKNWQVKVLQNKQLLDAGAITQSKYDEAVLGLERAKQASKSARIEMESAESEQNKTYLKSPVDGLMGIVKAHKGEFVSSQNKVLSVMEVADVHCEFSVLEKNIQDVKEGLNVTLTVDTFPEERFSGKMISLGSTVETTEGRARKVKAEVKNEENKLLPGMFAHVEVLLFQQEDAIIIPNTAFTDIAKDTSFVFVIENDNEGPRVKKREVTVTHFNNEQALIDSGLQVADQVVVDLTTVKIKEGDIVEIVEVKEAAEKK
jgi:membrane fusion protein (multidrug efflux system)